MPRRRALPLTDLQLLVGAQNNEPYHVREALDRGRSPNLQDHQGRSALLRACMGSAWTCVGLLLAAGADPNLADPSGHTPLLELAGQSDWRCDGQASVLLRCLLAAGANPNQANDLGLTALMAANDHPDRIHALLDAGADPNARTSMALKGATVLTAAVLNGVGLDAVVRAQNLLVLTALLAGGADPNGVDGNGRTPLILTVDEPFAVPLARALIDHGASLDQVAPRFGQSPRQRVRALGRPAMQALIEAHDLRRVPLTNVHDTRPRARL